MGPEATTYRAAWRRVVAALCVPGLLILGLSATASTIAMAAVLAGMLSCMATTMTQRASGDGMSWSAVRQGAKSVALGTLALLAFASYVAFLGSVVLWIAIGLAATSPPVARWVRRHSGDGDGHRHVGPEHEALTAGVPPVIVGCRPVAEDMSTEELLAAWRRTGRDLRRACPSHVRAHIVSSRQRYLDELERRDPEGVRSWLLSGAGSDADPRGFLRTGRRDSYGPG